ncbi:MAG: tetratricopeptide repeat protein, partial [Bryobacteraceae bacterium]
MRRRYRCVFLSLLLIAVYPATGQKKLQVKMPHPPILGESLAGARVILGEVTGRCSQEFSSLLRQDLLAHDIPLVAQAEPGVTAVVTISVDISECQALPEPAIIGSGLPAMHISRTVGHFLATLHVKDWWSGEELATQTLRADPSKQNESPTTQPEWPAPADFIATARLQALGQTRRLYEPWIDTEEMQFMDDKDCNLRTEFELFKAADYKGLLQAALANSASCHSNPKTVAAAWYNLGIAYMVMQNYDGALAAFAKTGKLAGSRMVTDAAAQC